MSTIASQITAVVLTYNVEGVKTGLRLTPEIIADIFTGRIVKWNDSALVKANPGVELPARDIVVVHRSDGSGTSYIFTDYLSKAVPAWNASVGKGKEVKWPVGLGAKGNEGVAGQVKQLPGTLGYVELAYARQNKLSFADMKNASGAFITPSLDSVTEALASAKIPEDFRFSMVNPPGEKAYPISGATWLLVYEEQKDPAKGKKLVEFLNWAMAKGEPMAAALDYAPLPEPVQARVVERIKTIKY
jgi:phosphate transport system substrate-binding protein